MELTQSDRDKLRKAQQNIKPDTVIGNIVEHKIQNPLTYKKLSRQDEGIPLDTNIDVFKAINIQYQSTCMSNFNGSSKPEVIPEHKDLDLPISTEDVASNSWLNMGKLELDKLEWMTNVADKQYANGLGKSTMFDKNGRAQSPQEVIACNRRNEQCHDIDGLVKLIDSTYPPQSTYALSVVSKIASLATMGYYDGCFSENIHQVLITNFLLRARNSLDDSNDNVCLAGLRCLRFLICNTDVDEVILDRVHPLLSDRFVPAIWLETEGTPNKRFHPDLTDIQCVELDAVFGLIDRTNIIVCLQRLIREKAQFNPIYYDLILDLLIRMVRHSPEVCVQFIELHLVDLIVDMSVSKGIRSPKLIQVSTKALKFIRIVAHAITELEYTAQVYTDSISSKLSMKVIQLIGLYLNAGWEADSLDEQYFRLHLETFRLIKILLKLDRFKDILFVQLGDSRATLFKMFRTVAGLKVDTPPESKISVDWQYAAHLVDIMGHAKRYESYQPNTQIDISHHWESLLKPAVLTWITEIVSMKAIPHFDISVAIATAVYHFRKKEDDYAMIKLKEVLIDSIVSEGGGQKNCNMNLYKALIRSASNDSQLTRFQTENGKLRDPSNLPSHGILKFNSSTQVVFSLSQFFDTYSPFVLLEMFTDYLHADSSCIRKTLETFVDNVDLIRYIRSIAYYHTYPKSYERQVQASFVTQYEVQIITKSLLLLARFYLTTEDLDDNGMSVDDNIEPNDLSHKVECYSNLCYYTISLVGLFNADTEQLIELKDRIFYDILLNPCFHARVGQEQYMNKRKHLYTGINIGESSVDDLSETNLQTLVPLYTSFDWTDRFWLMQPLLKFYKALIVKGEISEDSKESRKKWFHKNTPVRTITAEFALYNDKDIIATLLLFNYTMMQCSPSYTQLLVKPNLEEYICLSACVFLDDEVFMEPKVSTFFRRNLEFMLRECLKIDSGISCKLFTDASKVIEALDLPLADLFNKLVDQYEAVSYGDQVFSNFMLLFLATSSDRMFRKKLFSEKLETCLAQLRIDPTSVWAPQELFFSQVESDAETKQLIMRSSPYLRKGSFLWNYKQFHSQPL